LYCTTDSPKPFAASQSMITRFAAVTSRPFRLISALAELIAGPSPVYASPSKPTDGSTVRMIGRPNAFAKSQSR
jgi:hypothetical protein